MKRNFDLDTGEYVDSPSVVQEFLQDIRKLYMKYNICLTHEDAHGSFIINNEYNPEEFDRLTNCSIKGFNNKQR